MGLSIYLEKIDDAQIEIWCGDQAFICCAPILPPNESVTLKDIHTTEKIQKVLCEIQKRVIELGGTATIDYEMPQWEHI